MRKAVLIASVFLGSAMALSGQSAFTEDSAAEVSFHLDRPTMEVPRFTIHLHEDGTGRYEAEQITHGLTAASVSNEPAQQINRTMQLHPEIVAKIFKAARELNYFGMTCSTTAKNIADTGKKTLSYTGADGHGSCAYNFSDNKRVMMLNDTFLAIVYTMDEGRKLEFLHRYDRLGLDAEISTLSQEVQAGRALELGTIAQTLNAIAGDTAVMQRVRQQATRLLAQAN